MAKSPGDATCIVNERTGEQIVGSGVLRSYPAEALYEDDQPGDPADLVLLRAVFRDVRRSMGIREGEFHLAITAIEIHKRLDKVPPSADLGQAESQQVSQAVGYGTDGPLLFSEEGIKDAWVRYHGIAHSIERLVSPLREGKPANNEHAWLVRQLGMAWSRAHFGRPEKTYERIRCDLEIIAGFLRSDSCNGSDALKGLDERPKKKMEKRVADLKPRCVMRPAKGGAGVCCDCYSDTY